MPQYYIYLISSLPMLQFGLKPPFAMEDFLKLCKGKVPDRDLAVLEKLSLGGRYSGDNRFPVLKKWRKLDTALRNELVRIRSARLRREPEQYLRADGWTEPSIARVAMNAQRSLSLTEAERLLDEERWRMLDEFCAGHYFDMEFLIIYTYKLLILLRWEGIRSADSARSLEQALA